MKHFYLFFLTLICFIASGQKSEFELLQSKSETKILYDKVFSNSRLLSSPKERINATYFRQVFSEISRSDGLNRLPDYDVFLEKTTYFTRKGITPIAILSTKIESLKSEVLENGLVKRSSGQFDFKTEITDGFQTHDIALSSVTLDRIKGKKISFVVPDELIFSVDKSVSQIQYQFDNETNWHTIEKNQVFSKEFEQQGIHNLNLRIAFSDGTQKILYSSFQNYYSETSIYNRSALSVNAVQEITATIPYQGFGESSSILGKGEYEIFLDNTNQVLDKPIFIVDGYDPNDTRNITLIYESLSNNAGQNLADYLRSLGYDIIILNFPNYTVGQTTVNGGADFIQRNAMILVELINQINTQKVGNEQNVVIGPSMGGLISRYALRYMEMNNLEHDTRLYISFDSPHLGANIPIGFQHLFNYAAFGPLANTAAQEIINNSLKSPAARQMLIDHFEGHLQSNSLTEFNSAITLPTGAPNFRTSFQNELNTMGFPQNVRNVSVSNGASNGTGFGTPGMDVMNYTLNISDTQRVIINLKYTPAAGQTNQVSRIRGQQFIFIWITALESIANSQAPSFTNGLDTAPGGMFLIEALAGGSTGNAQLDEFLNNILVDRFCFIPALSSLAVTSTNNLYSPTASAVSPFDATFIPNTNQSHVEGTEENITFIINEILNNTMANETFALEQITIQNPIQNNQLNIFSGNSLENVKISLTDISGKTIFETKIQNSNGTYSLPVPVQSGLYFVTLATEKTKVTKKVLKN